MRHRLIALYAACAVGIAASAALGARLPPNEIAFTAPPRGIHLLDVRTGSVLPVHYGGRQTTHSPNWTPDARALIFAAGPAYAARDMLPSGIYRSGAHGQQPYVVATMPVVSTMELSPDGRYLAFADLSWVYIIDAGTGARAYTIPVSAPGDSMGRVDWSPQGDRLAYASGRQGERKLFIFDPASGASEELLRRIPLAAGESIYLTAFDWSPSGEQMVFFGIKDQRSQLAILDLQSLSLRWLDVLPNGLGSTWALSGIVWSPDGDHVAFNVEGGAIALVDLALGRLVTVVSGQWPVWAPDGDSILYMAGTEDGQTALMQYALHDGAQGAIITHPYAFQSYHWRPR